MGIFLSLARPSLKATLRFATKFLYQLLRVVTGYANIYSHAFGCARVNFAPTSKTTREKSVHHYTTGNRRNETTAPSPRRRHPSIHPSIQWLARRARADEEERSTDRSIRARVTAPASPPARTPRDEWPRRTLGVALPITTRAPCLARSPHHIGHA